MRNFINKVVTALSVVALAGCAPVASVLPTPVSQGAVAITKPNQPLASQVAASAAKPNEPSVSEVAANFTKFNQITADPVFINPEFTYQCSMLTSDQLDAARKQHGPHASAAILVYMNDLSAGAFRSKAAPYPVGSVIVKEKLFMSPHMIEGKPIHQAESGVGGMIKRPAGYDSNHGDWEYFYFEDIAKIESGRISSCVQCHEMASSSDYVFGAWNKTGP